MRILYGCNSQGHGHLGKAAVLVPLLEARGHEVRVVSSGPTPPPGLPFSWSRHLPGLRYEIEQGRALYTATARKWAADSPQLLQRLWVVRGIVQEFEPELILSDFEPFTASPLLTPPCEVVSLCRQAALLDPAIATPAPRGLQARLARSMIRLFTMGADRRLGYHYQPASYCCVPPVIRPELALLRPDRGDHLLVYNYHHLEAGSADQLIHWANNRRIPVRAYGFEPTPRGQAGYVRFQPTNRRQMLLDMAGARAVITTAGLSTPVEAFLLAKPVCVVPLVDQWEQFANAAHLEQARMAVASPVWNYDLALEIAPPTDDHPLLRWLTTSAETVLDAVLSGCSVRRPAAA